jgi:hypothetical protein
MTVDTGYALHPTAEEVYEYTVASTYEGRDSGDVEAPTGWFAIVMWPGNERWHIVSHDDLGYSYLSEYMTREQAEADYASLEDNYAKWNAGDDEAEEDDEDGEDGTRVRYPDVEVQLTGQDGNTAAIIGRVTRALRRAGHGDVIAEFAKDIMDAASYDDAIQRIMKWVEVA